MKEKLRKECSVKKEKRRKKQQRMKKIWYKKNELKKIRKKTEE